MSQDSIVIFRNIIQALDVLPPELYKEVSRLVYAYAFDRIMPPESTEPAALALFLSFKPQIDINVKRYESYRERGKKGGAPKGNNNAKKKTENGNYETTEQLETSKNNLKQATNKQKQPYIYINIYKYIVVAVVVFAVFTLLVISESSPLPNPFFFVVAIF